MLPVGMNPYITKTILVKTVSFLNLKLETVVISNIKNRMIRVVL